MTDSCLAPMQIVRDSAGGSPRCRCGKCLRCHQPLSVGGICGCQVSGGSNRNFEATYAAQERFAKHKAAADSCLAPAIPMAKAISEAKRSQARRELKEHLRKMDDARDVHFAEDLDTGVDYLAQHAEEVIALLRDASEQV
jgi:hypothetical protein